MRNQTNADIERRLETLFLEEAPRFWRSLLLSTQDPGVANDAVAEAFARRCDVARSSMTHVPACGGSPSGLRQER